MPFDFRNCSKCGKRIQRRRHTILQVCDITKEAEVQALNKLVARQFEDRHISVLINNAGVAKSNASLMDGDSSAWLQMINTNVLGMAMCCREVCRAMKAANSWGHIINISSLSGALRAEISVNQCFLFQN